MDVREIERTLKRVLRIGKIVDINASECKARVEFSDNDIVSHELPIIMPHSNKDKIYHMPSIDEFVLCAFLPIGRETGFILGSYYSEPTPPPVDSADKFNITFEDGSILEYDKAEHILTADIKGSCHIVTAKEIDVKTDDRLTVTAAKSIDIKTDETLSITAAKDITIKTDADVKVECKNALVKADKVDLGDSGGKGVVTMECFCALTGGPHPDASKTVNAIK